MSEAKAQPDAAGDALKHFLAGLHLITFAATFVV